MPVDLGDATYNNDIFKGFINSYYYPLDRMKLSVDKLVAAADDIDIKTMEYGEYQPILEPLENWPGGRGKGWRRSVAYARFSLKKQKFGNGTKWDALNDAIRKCFDPVSPIPMIIDVKQKERDKPGADEHDIELDWKSDDEGRLYLKFTMTCPYGSRYVP